MSGKAKSQGKRREPARQTPQPAPTLGQQPEAGDDLDERQRLGSADSGRRARADGGNSADQPGQRARISRDDNDAGQNRLNEAG